MPFLIFGAIAAATAVGGYFVADGAKSMTKLIVIGGVAYFVLFTPTGNKLIKKVIG